MRPSPPDRASDAASWRRHLRFWRTDVQADVDEELRFHIDSAADEYVARGVPCDEAQRLARRRFGDIPAITDTLHALSEQRERQMQYRERLQTIAQDLRFALRQLARNPGFAIVAMLTLALGIGATSAIFSVVNSVLLRPLPYAHADRLIQLREKNGPNDRTGMFVTFGNYAEWVRSARSFAALGAFTGDRGRTLTGSGDPVALRVTRASASYWKAQYIPPAAGRYYTEVEDQPGAEPVVVLSNQLWQSQFAGDKRVVGQTIVLNGIAHRVVGVAAPEYAMTPQAAQSSTIWLPLAMTASQIAEHADHELTVVGLPRDGVTQQAALAELSGIEGRLAQDYPHSYFDGGIIATPLREAVIGDMGSILWLLFGAVGLVLLIACVNVTNLLLARSAVRQKEMAIRSAIGGSRRRIVRQLLVESVVLALGGAIAGLALATAGVRLLVQSAPANIPRLQDVHLDVSMLLFTMVLGLTCGIAFGLAPAMRASRPDLRGALSAVGREGAAALRKGLRASLVVGQIALTLVLLVAAGLLLRSAVRLQRIQPGFDPANVLVAGISLPETRYTTDELSALTFNRTAATVAAVPGVASAAFISRIPIGSGGMDCSVRAEGATQGDGRDVGANQRSVTPGLFATLGISMERGRDFAVADRAGAPLVVVVNKSLAQQLFGATDPIGRRLASCMGNDGAPEWRTVIGVIGDVRANGLSNDPPSEVYYPLEQRNERGMSLVIRGKVPVATLVPKVRGALAEIDPLLPLSGVATMQDIVARSVAVPRFVTLLFGLLGGLGLVLAVIGIYGIIAYFVAQRTREIGLRIALGAQSSRVIELVVRQGVLLVFAGISIGLVVSWASAAVLERLLFQVSAHDPLIFGGVASLLVIVAVAASAVPAWRAVHVDPLIALRA